MRVNYLLHIETGNIKLDISRSYYFFNLCSTFGLDMDHMKESTEMLVGNIQNINKRVCSTHNNMLRYDDFIYMAEILLYKKNTYDIHPDSICSIVIEHTLNALSYHHLKSIMYNDSLGTESFIQYLDLIHGFKISSFMTYDIILMYFQMRTEVLLDLLIKKLKRKQ